jgi:UDPglucose 6-dehydrogenase
MDTMKVSVFGAGYVGLVTAACLAEMGNGVLCLDVDEQRVRELDAGRMPIHEPGLAELVTRNRAAGRLTFTSDAALAVRHGTIVFIAVGTPAGDDGAADLSQVFAAAEAIGQHMGDYKVVVNKSTVPVGSADRVRALIAERLRARATILPFAVVSNPEFLKEGAAIDDFMRPDRVIVGSDDEQAIHLMRALYAPFLRNRDRVLELDTRSAELAKYAANAMLALRISFMNELATLAERVGADIEQVRLGIGSDPRIGSHFLYAGCGWGGSCFPKDTAALERMGREAGLRLSLVQATREVNERQKRRLAERVVERFGAVLTQRTFAVWGLAFKPGTDDLRDAPSRVLIDELLSRGARVRACDPAAAAKARATWPARPALEYVDDPYAAADGADALVVVTEWRQFRSPDFERLRALMKAPIVFDGRNLFEPATMRAAGFEHVPIGRAATSVAPLADAPAGRRAIPEAVSRSA